jgi:5-dehydro-2-deoxygluconokinase
MKRVAILTSGGDTPGMNAVISGVCERVEAQGATVFGVRWGFAGLARGELVQITSSEAARYAGQAGTWLGSSRWGGLHDPAGAHDAARKLAGLDIDGLIVLGGDGSLMGARRLAEQLAPVVFVPCTIDNDIPGSAMTIGVDSAVRYAVDVIDRLRVTGRSLPGRGFLVQTLGGSNGHLACAVAEASGVQEVLVPEQPFELDHVAARLGQQARTGTAIAVMCEGVSDGVTIAGDLARLSGLRIHPTILGHAQRAGTPTATDRQLAERAAETAVAQLATGRSAYISLAGQAAFTKPLLENDAPPLARVSLTPQEKSMSGEIDQPLYILAFDHRTSFQRGLFGISSPTQIEREQMRTAKQLILSAVLQAREALPDRTVAALVDEEHGASSAMRARASGLMLAMCAEKSSQAEFDFEFGEEFAEHIRTFSPDLVKVLARINPDSDPQSIRRQCRRLRRLSQWLKSRPERFLFELIVPPEPHHLTAAGGNPEAYAREIRPGLVVAAIELLQDVGVEPDVWKVEGLEHTTDCERVVAAARASGRSHVSCIVLGAGAGEETIAHWLSQCAPVAGFNGFAIGRTIWWEALDQWRKDNATPEATVSRIADAYTRLIKIYETAGGLAADASTLAPQSNGASRPRPAP